jgi:membrane-associated phospholipid phosphatase
MIFVLLFLAIFAAFWLFFYVAGPSLERLLARAANYTAHFRYRDYLSVFVLLTAGVVLALIAGDAFLDLAEALQDESPELQRVDAEVHDWARETRTSGSTTFFTALTIIGTPVGLAIIAVLVAIPLLWKRRFRWASYLLLTSITGGLLNLQLKAYFARARPELAEALRGAHGYSFPSGHAMGSAVVFGALAYLAFRLLHQWRWRALAIALSFTMIVAIAASRIYLGVHWISDVAAGIAAGAIWVTATTVAYEAIRRIRLVRELRRRAEGESAGP